MPIKFMSLQVTFPVSYRAGLCDCSAELRSETFPRFSVCPQVQASFSPSDTLRMSVCLVSALVLQLDEVGRCVDKQEAAWTSVGIHFESVAVLLFLTVGKKDCRIQGWVWRMSCRVVWESGFQSRSLLEAWRDWGEPRLFFSKPTKCSLKLSLLSICTPR